MNKYLLLLLLVIGRLNANAQCLTNSLVINTGYDPLTGLAIPGGANGGTPVPDPHWKITYESPGIAAALTPGLIEVVPGAAADIITMLGGWISDPVGTPGGWISCLNSNTYTTDGTGPTGTVYEMICTRPFRNCTDDSIKLDFWVADDNYITSIDVDGILTTFSQPAIASPTTFSTFSHFTNTFFLPAGTHNINVKVFNYNEVTVVTNPTGLEIYGTVSSAGLLNSLVSESYGACAAYSCTNNCNSISLVDSLHPCAGDVVVLSPTIIGTDSILSYTWSPATGLSGTTILSPTLTVGTTSGYYHLNVKSLIPFNLVYNGDFSAGNVGFTSSYIYSPPPSTTLIEGDYSVYTNPFGVHTGFTTMGDHTTGTGNMLIVNGGPTPTDVWCETIPVTPNTDYDFSAWIANCSSVTVGPDVPIMQFKINGVLLGVPATISSAPGVWTNFFQVWNSGVSTTATICIYDNNTTSSGNDFAIDDITFQEICIAKDSVYIAVKVPDTTAARKDTTLCIALAPITLYATPGYVSYLWNTGAATASILAPFTGTYWVYNNNHCVTLIDTYRVNYIPLPVINLGNDTAFCIGNSLVLSSVQPPGSSYLWSTGNTTNTITVSTTGAYWLQVYNGFCTAADTIHVTISPHPVVDLGPDTFSCMALPITLQSSIPYTAPSYLWSTAAATPSISVSLSGTYWLKVTVAGCAGADTINVTIIYDTFRLFNNDTAICRGKQIPVFLNSNPLATFQWLPTAGIANPNIGTPVIAPDTSAMYHVTISLAGCPDINDSFYIDVQPVPIIFAGGNKSVCEFDTLHLHAFVNPAWYTHYTYSWTPAANLDDSAMSTVIFRAGPATKLFLTVTTPAGCSSIDSAQIFVHPGNFASLDSSFNLCPHDSVQLKPSGSGVSYRWHPGLYLSDSTTATPWVHAITSLGYTAIVTDAFGCLDTIHANVIIRPAGQIFLGDSVKIYPGESDQINPQTNCTYFSWFPPAGLDYAYISNPVATPQVSTKYVVHGKTEWGCDAVDSISIYFDISSILALPNAFTPGAGINNKLLLLKRGEATLTYFRIFNRWGNRVFETKNIDEGWDGTYKGVPQPYGVYVYQIEAVTNTGNIFRKNGNVTLVR